MIAKLLGGLGLIISITACSPLMYDRNEDLKALTLPVELDKSQTEVRQQIFEAFEKYSDPETHPGMKRYYAQSLVMAGREDIPFFDDLMHSRSGICTDVENINRGDIPTLLADLIGNKSLVIINEDHKMARDRAFILNLIKVLKSKGFTHYAAETFAPNISESTFDYAISGDGYYSNEPIFGRLLSYAKATGFELVAYEQTDDQRLPDNATRAERIDARENAQRDNLIKAVLGKAPETKIIIHVGHSHVAEIPIPNRSGVGATEWMAARLKQETGINPLTISQTACASDTEKLILARTFVDQKGSPGIALTDYAVGHSKLSFTKNRPNWRRIMGDQEAKIPETFNASENPIIVEARYAYQTDKAVPTDRLLLLSGEADIPLLLPQGSYRIEAFDKNGRIADAVLLDVPAN